MKHLLALVAVFAFTGFTLHAETPTPAAPPAVPAEPAAPTPAAPSPATQTAPAAPARREEDEVNAPAAPVQASARVGLGAQIKALLGGAQSHALQITERDNTIAQLTRDLATARQTIQTQMTELTQLRELRTELEQSVAGLTQSATTVADTVATLGFDQSALPGATSDIPDDAASLRAKMIASTDPKEKHRLAQQLRALSAKKKD